MFNFDYQPSRNAMSAPQLSLQSLDRDNRSYASGVPV